MQYYIMYQLFFLLKIPILNVIKSVLTTVGVIMKRFVSALKVTWASIAALHYAIRNA